MGPRLSIDEITGLIDAQLTKGYPSLEVTAGLLRVSPRSLQRLLDKLGFGYGDLVADRRRRIACDRLANTDMAVRDIAAALAYCDVSSFSRAFRRWTGQSPRDYRKQRRGRLSSVRVAAQPDADAASKLARNGYLIALNSPK